MSSAEVLNPPVSKGRKEVVSSPQSRKLRMQEKVAKGIIWGLAALTIAILVWIVGYLMVKGLRYNNMTPYNVTPYVERVIDLDGTEDDLVFIINRGVREQDIEVDGLRTLFNKRRNENWGFYNEQNLRAQPVVNENAGDFSVQVKDFILAGEDLDDYRGYVEKASSWDEVISYVGGTEGAIGFLPASEAADLPRDVKVLGVRRKAIAVNPSVLMIKDSRMLRELTDKQAEKIAAGEVSNWMEVGGTDLPLTLLDSENIEVNMEALQSTEGAVMLTDYRYVAEYGVRSVPVLRHETGWNLTWHFITEAPARSGQWGGISYIIINTFFLILFTILFSAPVGVMAAIYMVEYAKQGRLMRILRMGTETLSGIPSIVFGLFGFIFFVRILGMGIGFISSTLTVTLMVLPTIIRTSEEALKSVPQSFREGSLALGATKLQTIIKVVLPAASPGILTGIILAVGRTVGETAVLIYTLGSNYDLVSGPSSSARVLSLHLYMLFSEALSFDRTFATGAVLVILILLTNFSATFMMKRMNKNSGM